MPKVVAEERRERVIKGGCDARETRFGSTLVGRGSGLPWVARLLQEGRKKRGRGGKEKAG